MSEEFDMGEDLAPLVAKVVESYRAEARTRHIGRVVFPSRREIVELIHHLLELTYPGFVGRQDLTDHNVSYHIGELLPRIGTLASRQIYRSLCYAKNLSANDDASGLTAESHNDPCRDKAREITRAFLHRLPAIRTTLAEDVQAAYDGDPAASGLDEIILAYPGLLAVTVYRIAHELHVMGVPLMPRVMSEWCHHETGIDIHPGATIGKSFFLDHGTGVVIGETTEIGDCVKIYQGVTLGALSFPKDESGRVIRGHKRHPTVEDHVTLYANAIILGGDTVIGAHSVVGGSVFLTRSIPPASTVTITPPDLRVKAQDGVMRLVDGETQTILPDYQI